MSLVLWPRDYERKPHISKYERALLQTASKNFTDGHFVVGIDPLGLCTQDNRMGLYISPKQGVVTFTVYTEPFNEALVDFGYIKTVSETEDKIYERLLESKALISRCGDKKVLKFPYKHIMVFEAVDRTTLKVSQDLLDRVAAYATARNFTPINNKKAKLMKSDLDLFTNVRKDYDTNKSVITDLECRAIFNKLASEYVVVVPEIEKVELEEGVSSQITESELRITGREQEYKTFFLDDEQVGIVNDMGKGHRVMLANPGAGKSVLLLSKAFKYASTYKDSSVLLTCYNSNLFDAYMFKRHCANFGNNRNLYVLTFHKLVKKLFNDCLGRSLEGEYASDEEIQECINAAKAGRIKQRFIAIFIDEVQIFEPKYLELCFALLKEPVEESLILMAGDLNQTVRLQSRKGDAPWKKIDGMDLDYKGRVKYIKKNYRNTKEIGEYLQRMLLFMNEKITGFGGIIPTEYDYDQFEINPTPSTALKIRNGISRYKITEEVIKAVIEIVDNYDVSYSDIAVIFPFKQMKTLDYYFMHWLTEALKAQGIPFCSILSSDHDTYRKYSQTSGVVLTTIDSSLGLDFKAVILAGLYPYNYVYDDKPAKYYVNSWGDINGFGEGLKERFIVEARKTYTAASRAREILYVLSDLKIGTPIDELITR